MRQGHKSEEKVEDILISLKDPNLISFINSEYEQPSSVFLRSKQFSIKAKSHLIATSITKLEASIDYARKQYSLTKDGEKSRDIKKNIMTQYSLIFVLLAINHSMSSDGEQLSFQNEIMMGKVVEELGLHQEKDHFENSLTRVFLIHLPRIVYKFSSDIVNTNRVYQLLSGGNQDIHGQEGANENVQFIKNLLVYLNEINVNDFFPHQHQDEEILGNYNFNPYGWAIQDIPTSFMTDKIEYSLPGIDEFWMKNNYSNISQYLVFLLGDILCQHQHNITFEMLCLNPGYPYTLKNMNKFANDKFLKKKVDLMQLEQGLNQKTGIEQGLSSINTPKNHIWIKSGFEMEIGLVDTPEPNSNFVQLERCKQLIWEELHNLRKAQYVDADDSQGNVEQDSEEDVREDGKFFDISNDFQGPAKRKPAFDLSDADKTSFKRVKSGDIEVVDLARINFNALARSEHALLHLILCNELGKNIAFMGIPRDKMVTTILKYLEQGVFSQNITDIYYAYEINTDKPCDLHETVALAQNVERAMKEFYAPNFGIKIEQAPSFQLNVSLWTYEDRVQNSGEVNTSKSVSLYSQQIVKVDGKNIEKHQLNCIQHYKFYTHLLDRVNIKLTDLIIDMSGIFRCSKIVCHIDYKVYDEDKSNDSNFISDSPRTYTRHRVGSDFISDSPSTYTRHRKDSARSATIRVVGTTVDDSRFEIRLFGPNVHMEAQMPNKETFNESTLLQSNQLAIIAEKLLEAIDEINKEHVFQPASLIDKSSDKENIFNRSRALSGSYHTKTVCFEGDDMQWVDKHQAGTDNFLHKSL
jgi:hypothetical protein